MDAGLKILILEDRKSDADLILFEMKKSGIGFISHIVQSREDYESALDTFHPDIILSDYSIPAFDGITAFNITQKKYPEVPFIIISSAIGEENAVEMIKNGVTDYVLKNKLFTLNTKVARALKEAAERTERDKTLVKMQEEYEQLLKASAAQTDRVQDALNSTLTTIEQTNVEGSAGDQRNALANNLRQLVAELEQVRTLLADKTKQADDMRENNNHTAYSWESRP